MGTFGARRGRWSLLFDGIYTRISSDNAIQTASFNRAEAVSTTGILNPALGHRVWENKLISFVTAGARIWIVNTEVKLSGTQSAEFSDTKTWADPAFGGRLRAKLGHGWFATALGDVGGFGVSSRLT